MPVMTRAVIDFEQGQPLAVEEIGLPDPGPSEVRVRLFASGICHSQLHQLHNPESNRPLLLGHEATGMVEAAGREVTHVREGDHVMLTWVPRDITEETARFTRSRAVVREQEVTPAQVYTWAEHVLCHEQMVLPLDADLPTDVTAIVGCAVVTGVGAVLGTARVQPGETMAVFGVGGVGINIIAGGRIAGAGRIIAVDLLDEKLDFARQFGATDVVNASQVDAVEAIRELTGGGVDFAFDGIGMESVLNQCLECIRPGILGLRRGGTAVSVGIPQGGVTLRPRLFPGAERTLLGSLGGSSHPVEDFPKYLQWYREGLLPLDLMVTKRYEGIDAINEGVQALERGEIRGRSIMVYEQP